MTLFLPHRSVLVDSSAYLALSDWREQRHRDAVAILERIVFQRWQVFTTNFVVAESHALILNRLNRTASNRFLRDVDAAAAAGTLGLIRVEPEDELRAREIIHRYTDKDFSLTDATSFSVMDRLGIRTAFTFDRDFAQYGLDVLTPVV